MAARDTSMLWKYDCSYWRKRISAMRLFRTKEVVANVSRGRLSIALVRLLAYFVLLVWIVPAARYSLLDQDERAKLTSELLMALTIYRVTYGACPEVDKLGERLDLLPPERHFPRVGFLKYEGLDTEGIADYYRILGTRVVDAPTICYRPGSKLENTVIGLRRRSMWTLEAENVILFVVVSVLDILFCATFLWRRSTETAPKARDVGD